MSTVLISAIIPTLNAEATLERTLLCLNGSKLIAEIIVADGGSTDRSRSLAENFGAKVCFCEQGRGRQLADGAARANQDWLLFLHADTVLEPGWEQQALSFIAHTPEDYALVFHLRLDDKNLFARLLERLVALRVHVFGLAYGDQGLLIPKKFYTELGGYRPLPLMEDVDLMRRIGRRRLSMLNAAAITSAERYRRGGYIRRPLRNLFTLMLYFCGVSPEKLEKFYR